MTRKAWLFVLAGMLAAACATPIVSGVGFSGVGFTATDYDLDALIPWSQAPPSTGEVLLVVTVGNDVPRNKAVRVARAVSTDTYDSARASRRDPRNSAREANVLFFRSVKPDVFDTPRGVPLVLAGRASRIVSVHAPYENGAVDMNFIRGLPLPRYARRAVASLIDTSTGEIPW